MSFLFGSSSETKTTPTLTAQGQGLFDQLHSFGTSLLTDPSSGLQPIKQAGEESINNSYGNIPQVISSSLAKRGYGSSGSMGDSLYKTQLARLGSLSQYQGQFANLVSNRQLAGGSLMDQLMQTQVGSDQTKKTVDPSQFFSALGSLGSLLMPNGIPGLGGGGGGEGSGAVTGTGQYMPPNVFGTGFGEDS
jgi:hypothetical protein